jgi:hypothetical protein
MSNVKRYTTEGIPDKAASWCREEHDGDMVRYHDYATLLARYNALVEAMAWERKAADAHSFARVLSGYGQLAWATENLKKARAEVDRLIADSSAADCKGEG